MAYHRQQQQQRSSSFVGGSVPVDDSLATMSAYSIGPHSYSDPSYSQGGAGGITTPASNININMSSNSANATPTGNSASQHSELALLPQPPQQQQRHQQQRSRHSHIRNGGGDASPPLFARPPRPTTATSTTGTGMVGGGGGRRSVTAAAALFTESSEDGVSSRARFGLFNSNDDGIVRRRGGENGTGNGNGNSGGGGGGGGHAISSSLMMGAEADDGDSGGSTHARGMPPPSSNGAVTAVARPVTFSPPGHSQSIHGGTPVDQIINFDGIGGTGNAMMGNFASQLCINTPAPNRRGGGKGVRPLCPPPPPHHHHRHHHHQQLPIIAPSFSGVGFGGGGGGGGGETPLMAAPSSVAAAPAKQRRTLHLPPTSLSSGHGGGGRVPVTAVLGNSGNSGVGVLGGGGGPDMSPAIAFTSPVLGAAATTAAVAAIALPPRGGPSPAAVLRFQSQPNSSNSNSNTHSHNLNVIATTAVVGMAGQKYARRELSRKRSADVMLQFSALDLDESVGSPTQLGMASESLLAMHNNTTMMNASGVSYAIAGGGGGGYATPTMSQQQQQQQGDLSRVGGSLSQMLARPTQQDRCLFGSGGGGGGISGMSLGGMAGGGTISGGAVAATGYSQAETDYSNIFTKRVLNDFREIRELGCGAFGRVALYETATAARELVAIKASAPAHHGSTAEKTAIFRRELAVMTRLKSVSNSNHGRNHLVQLISAWEESSSSSPTTTNGGGGDGASQIYIQMEYCPGGSVSALAERKRAAGEPWAESEVLVFLLHMAIALDAMHSADVAHVDFKPENVLMDVNGGYTLSDFGCSVVLDARGRARRDLTFGSNHINNTNTNSNNDATDAAAGMSGGGGGGATARSHMANTTSNFTAAMLAEWQAQEGHNTNTNANTTATATSAVSNGIATDLSPAALWTQASVMSVDEGDCRYLCSDMLNRKQHFKAGDLFSLGMSLYELMSGQPLPRSGELFLHLRRSDNANANGISCGGGGGNALVNKLCTERGYSPRLVGLVDQLLSEEPTARPTAREVLTAVRPPPELLSAMGDQATMALWTAAASNTDTISNTMNESENEGGDGEEEQQQQRHGAPPTSVGGGGGGDSRTGCNRNEESQAPSPLKLPGQDDNSNSNNAIGSAGGGGIRCEAVGARTRPPQQQQQEEEEGCPVAGSPNANANANHNSDSNDSSSAAVATATATAISLPALRLAAAMVEATGWLLDTTLRDYMARLNTNNSNSGIGGGSGGHRSATAALHIDVHNHHHQQQQQQHDGIGHTVGRSDSYAFSPCLLLTPLNNNSNGNHPNGSSAFAFPTTPVMTSAGQNINGGGGGDLSTMARQQRRHPYGSGGGGGVVWPELQQGRAEACTPTFLPGGGGGFAWKQ